MQNKILIKAEVEAGLFPNERAVTIQTLAGPKSLLTYEAWIEEIDGRHYLRVDLLDEDDKALLVALPDEIIGEGRTVAVGRDLRHAHGAVAAR
jgi:hypothetical protein